MSEIKTIPLGDIMIPENRARSYDPLKAQALAGSIAEQGLFHPITVRAVGGAYELVLGLHRYRAAEMNKAETIEARVSDLSDDAARLAEVMENLVRAELIALDRCQHLYELKQIYERMYPEAKHGGNRKSEKIKRQSLPLDQDAPEIFGFADHVAEQIGLSQRSIRLAVKIWKGLSKDSRPRLYGTDLAKKQTELKALSELPVPQQGKVLDLIFDEVSDVTNVAGALAAFEGGVRPSAAERRVEQLRNGLKSVSDEAFDQLIDEQAERVIASLKRMGRL
jgi:ParB family chromosome partitioning protein